MKISPYFIFIAMAPQFCALPLPDNGQKTINGHTMVLSKLRLNNMRKNPQDSRFVFSNKRMATIDCFGQLKTLKYAR